MADETGDERYRAASGNRAPGLLRAPTVVPATTRGVKRRAHGDFEPQGHRGKVVRSLGQSATPSPDYYEDPVFNDMTESDFRKLEKQAMQQLSEHDSKLHRLNYSGRDATKPEGASELEQNATDDFGRQLSHQVGAIADKAGSAAPSISAYGDSPFDGMTGAEFEKLEKEAAQQWSWNDSKLRRLVHPGGEIASGGVASGSKRSTTEEIGREPDRVGASGDEVQLAALGSDEYADPVLDGLTAADFDKLVEQATPIWWEDDSKLYLLPKNPPRIGDADSWMQESYNRPTNFDNVLKIEEDGLLKLTPAGTAQLKDVEVMVWDRDRAYRLYRADEIKGRSLKQFYQKKLPQGERLSARSVGETSHPNVYLHDHRGEFHSIESYNRRYGTAFTPDAAEARFDAIMGRTSRDDRSRADQSRAAAAPARDLDDRQNERDLSR